MGGPPVLRRLSFFAVATSLVAAMAAGLGASPAVAAISPTYGTGAGFCASVTSAGYDLGAYFDDVYACGPLGVNDFSDPPFEDSDYGFQCTELADRFLWDAHQIAPVDSADAPGGSLYGGNFVVTVHAVDSSIPVVNSGTTTLPAAGDIISMWGGASGQGQSGDDSHVAVVTGITETSSGWTITVMEENGSASGRNSITVSANGTSWSYDSGYFTSFDWLAFAPATPSGVSAAGRDHSLMVSWSASGAPSYAATAAPGGASCSTSGTSCAITGLEDDTPYSVTVTASSPAGTSPPSAPVTAVPVDTTPDYTGNGYSDLAWLTANLGQPGTLWLFDGAHGFGTTGQTTGWGIPEPGVAGDFTGDGTSEIAWFQPATPGGSTGSIYLVSWNGTDWQATLARGPGVGRPIWVGAGDFAGTGYDDLAWLTAGPGSENTLWLFDGAHGFATVGKTTGWGMPEPGIVGDYGGNGRSEIAWFQTTTPGGPTGTIYLVSWNGTAWTAAVGRGPGVGKPVWAGAGDFAGTGYDDLAWLTANPGQLGTLWLFDGAHGFATVGQTTGFATPEPGVAGDFQGNGRSEIAWFQATAPGGPTGTIYLVSWNGTAWTAALGRGPGVGTPNFAATTSSSYDPPTVTSRPAVTLTTGSRLSSAAADSAVPVTVSWAVAPGGGPVCAQTVEKSTNGGASWTSLPAPSATATSLSTTLTPGKATMFRVQATGCGDVPGNWAATAPVTAHLLQETTAGIAYGSGWKRTSCSACSGGGQELTSMKNATAKVTIADVQALALVLSEGPSDGSATITDGASSAVTISTHASKARYRTYAYVQNWETAANRSITLTNLATAGHPDLQLDAVATLS